MSRKARLRLGGVGLVPALALAFAASAVASGLSPALLSPNHKSVNPGAIKLVVKVPVAPVKGGVFVAIQPNRKLKHGKLSGTCGVTKGCDFVGPKHWKGAKYRWTAAFNFPGYWAVTPGKYYWQVHYFKKGYTGVFWSAIGWFKVK